MDNSNTKWKNVGITKNNLRAEQSKAKIRRALMELLKHKNFNQIYVRDLCTQAGINRSTFYEHYQDINDLILKIEAELSTHVAGCFTDLPYTCQHFVNLFEYIRANADFYRAFLTQYEGSFMHVTDFKAFIPKIAKNLDVKIAFPGNEIIYHMAFFAAGLSALCKVWLLNGMVETPEQMAEILAQDYVGKRNAWFCAD